MASTTSPKFTTTQWLIIIIASIGFLFDTYELLMPMYLDEDLNVTNIKPYSSPNKHSYNSWTLCAKL